jgi:hypothetical protein
MTSRVNKDQKNRSALWVLVGTLIGTMAACGGGAKGSEPAKEPAKTSAAPAASGGAAPAGSAAGGAPGQDQIKAVLKQHSSELKVCYARETDRSQASNGPAFKGETKFRVKIEPSGKVADVQGVNTPPAGDFLATCVADSMKGWTFPSSSGGSSVTLPVTW